MADYLNMLCDCINKYRLSGHILAIKSDGHNLGNLGRSFHEANLNLKRQRNGGCMERDRDQLSVDFHVF